MTPRKFFIGRAVGLLVLAMAVVAWYVLSPFFLSNPSSPNPLDQEGAINTVITRYPELEAYTTTNLPPSSIETKEVAEGWLVGFIQRGSGLPGILAARCYQVSSTKNVVLLGTYTREPNQLVENIALETCAPAPTATSTSTTPTSTQLTPLGACYVGGCSSQLCSDQPDIVSTCEYRPEYACYKSEKCERQPSGQCGWTPTAKLAACLASPK